MKEYTKEVIETVVKNVKTYVAEDGTEFLSKRECRNYEAKCFAKKFNAVPKDETALDDIFKDFGLYGYLYLIRPETPEDIDLLNKRFVFPGYDCFEGFSEKHIGEEVMVIEDDNHIPHFAEYSPEEIAESFEKAIKKIRDTIEKKSLARKEG